MTRRQWLRGRFLAGLVAPLAEAVEAPRRDRPPAGPPAAPAPPAGRRRGTIPLLRPPGAVAEPQFLAGCTRCDACAQACPHDAIVRAPLRFREAAGTPMIDSARAPCWMCADTPCITACEPGVLRPDVPVRMGTAWIDEYSCLAHQNGFCTVCSEQCPVPGAIEVSAGKPRIREERCTGCGVCQHVCPAPANAVVLMPAPARPAAPVPEDES